KLSSGSDVINARTGHTEKIGKLYALCGKRQDEVAEAIAGDIVVAAKINAYTSDTLCAATKIISFDKIIFPRPCYSMAVKAKSEGDESKISSAFTKILEEDLTLSFSINPNTHEQILMGMGEQHLDVAVAKIKAKFGVDVELTQPKIPYRETITKKVKVQGKHKKQSGGHGQYGDVWIEFEPCVSDDLVFEEKVFGGSVPRNFFPAVEKGLQDCVKKGVLAGYPVVGLKAILVDGSYHPVDSSEMAFKMAATVAYKEGLKQAEPVLLEPIGKLEVIAPDENTGDIMGDLNKRRG
ncbi:MAG: elongation factor G, partial [Oscillospiraceae bacterium]